MKLADQIKESIKAGLNRRSVQKCSDWAQKYIVLGNPIPGPLTFKYHPWSRAMHDSEAPVNNGRKSAQAAYTQTVLQRTFFMIDVRRIDCLYVLPNKTPDAGDFSASRFDVMLELSEHLKKLFSDVKNVGHKRAGPTSLYIRGSHSESGLRSIPVGFMVLDEYDAMDQTNAKFAIERMSGQMYKQVWKISTPTIPNWGIDKEVQVSTEQRFFFKCPLCSRHTELTFPDCFVCTSESLIDPRIHDSYMQCKECKGKLDSKNKWAWLADGTWEVVAKKDPEILAWSVNQMYSSTISPVEFARSYIAGLSDPTEETHFYNNKLGLAHLVKGAQVTDDDFTKCQHSYNNDAAINPSKLRTMGVDVGSLLHCEILEWDVVMGPDINVYSTPKMIRAFKLKEFEDLDKVMRTYQIHGCVVDKFPEQRKAKEFADRFPGYVKLCYYSRGVAAKGITVRGADDFYEDHQINVDRTSWLDLSLSRFQKHTIAIPYDLPDEYKKQIKALVRVYEKDAEGNPIGRWQNTAADHYGHAHNYAEIALPLAASVVSNSDIGSFL